jgi:RHS repeat-associated protein
VVGRVVDPETGLIYLVNRYYDPTTSQFLTRDPLDAITRSAYGYVSDNPLNHRDPSGLEQLPPGDSGPVSPGPNLNDPMTVYFPGPGGSDGEGEGQVLEITASPAAQQEMQNVIDQLADQGVEVDNSYLDAQGGVDANGNLFVTYSLQDPEMDDYALANDYDFTIDGVFDPDAGEMPADPWGPPTGTTPPGDSIEPGPGPGEGEGLPPDDDDASFRFGGSACGGGGRWA